MGVSVWIVIRTISNKIKQNIVSQNIIEKYKTDWKYKTQSLSLEPSITADGK